MDWINKQRELYLRMDDEITSFIMHFSHDPAKAAIYLERLVQQVGPIGGRLMLDIEALLADVRLYARQPSKPVADRVQSEALRIKNEVREL